MDQFSDTSPLNDSADERLPAAAYLRYASRADGWSAGRQAAFLAHVADNGVVAEAARSVGMSLQGGYALRRQARGYAFNLGWEAALIIARRVVADNLMAAAIKGEVATWVREDGKTTYVRQNSKLALTLLDRVNPATTLPEVMAVATRFDWFLELIDRGASGEDFWSYFFDDALPNSEGAARARVRAALQLSEESAGFEGDEEGEEDDAPIEYKSMEGASSAGSAVDSFFGVDRSCHLEGKARWALQGGKKNEREEVGLPWIAPSAAAAQLPVFFPFFPCKAASSFAPKTGTTTAVNAHPFMVGPQ